MASYLQVDEMTATLAEHPHLGVGLYTIADAARLVKAHPETIRRWVGGQDGIIPRTLPSEEKLLTFQELMEIHFIQMFRSKGVSFQTIRKASARASEQFHTNYPFTVKRFDTDGRTVFSTLIKSGKHEDIIEDLERGQLVFKSIIRPFFKKLEYKLDTVARFWPLTKRGRVVLDPKRKFGKPIDAATGIATSVINEAVLAGGGQSPQEVARWLDIPVAAVNAAVEFERSLA